MSAAEVDAILQRASETLATAKHGYDDLVALDRTRRFTGLRNLIVFGRSLTWVLQNLKSHAPDFDAWYKLEQAQMAADPLMRYFVDARNNLEKQGRLIVETTMVVHNLSSDDIKRLPRPAGAESFFMGDHLGGSGWEVTLPDGRVEKYYIQLPAAWGESKQIFGDFPAAKAPELAGLPIEELCARYLKKLDELLARARAKFLPPPPSRPSRRDVPYLRRVK